jgi:hypothetical protein
MNRVLFARISAVVLIIVLALPQWASSVNAQDVPAGPFVFTGEMLGSYMDDCSKRMSSPEDSQLLLLDPSQTVIAKSVLLGGLQLPREGRFFWCTFSFVFVLDPSVVAQPGAYILQAPGLYPKHTVSWLAFQISGDSSISQSVGFVNGVRSTTICDPYTISITDAIFLFCEASAVT